MGFEQVMYVVKLVFMSKNSYYVVKRVIMWQTGFLCENVQL